MVLRISTLFFALMILLPALAQKTIPDLKKKLNLEKPDSAQVDLIIALSEKHYQNQQPDSAFYYLNKGLRLVNAIDKPGSKIKIYNALGFLNHNTGAPETAIRYLRQAIALMKEHPTYSNLKGDIYTNLANSYRRTTQIDSAYYFYREAENFYIEKSDQQNRWKVLIGLTRLFLETGDFSKAVDYAEKARSQVKTSDRISYGFTLYFLNLAYLYHGDLEKYTRTFDEWYTFKSQGASDFLEKDQRHADLVNTFGDDLDQSEQVMNNALAYAIEKKNPLIIGLHYHTLADVLLKNEKPEAAIAAYQKAVPYLRQINSRFAIRDCYSSIYSVSKAVNQPDQALVYLEKYVLLNDSLNQDKMQNNLRELEVQYQTEKKDQTILQQDRERNLLLASGALLVVLGIIIILFLRNRLATNRKIASKEAELQAQKIQQLQQEKKLLTYNAMINGQEQERQRIAKDLHDGIGGLLSTVKAHFNAIQEEVVKLEKLNVYQKTNDLIDEACEEVRRISHDMMPRALEISGLDLAVEDLATTIKSKNLTCTLEIIGLNERLDSNKETMIYRILQELCTNVIKHSGAKNVLLQLIQKEQQLNILVEDDGQGFDLENRKKADGMGLKSIESRVKFLEGTINFDSVRGEGTTVNISIPL